MQGCVAALCAHLLHRCKAAVDAAVLCRCCVLKLCKILFIAPKGTSLHSRRQCLSIADRCVKDPEEWRICGDFKVQVFLDSITRSRSLFWAWHNTTFMAGTQSVLSREQLDKVHKSMPPDISMSLSWEPGQGHMYPLSAAAPAPSPYTTDGVTPGQSGELTRQMSRRSSLGQRPLVSSRFVELADIGPKGAAPCAAYFYLHLGSALCSLAVG